ncbi:GGDEF domain-containing protein [Paenisporosarcina antarctica]|uniref:GGDEF domain-containing protein n=1 Tax=Paenisporosarcina antarctica TaxID=417367 RepID=A0A4P7A1G3_9BACL|nr:GGDEF domain-containing protein [Paenisporosarcina antarctica]QBP42448.1 GGDEF domain-containing protein [Paenisporosarcina antarctica]
MEEQLNLAPFGYLVMDTRLRILDTNQTLQDWINLQDTPSHMHDLLTIASRIYFQTYFPPSIKMHGKVNEMYLTLKAGNEKIPILMNAVVRNQQYECVFVQMKERDEYENELLLAKRSAEKIRQDTEDAFKKLQGLMESVEGKQQELLEMNTQLQELVTTDPLTGLKNRRFLNTKLLEYVEIAKIEQSPFSLLLIDVDYFKRVNDTYGHPTGDAVLQELSWKLQSEARDSDIVARMGGEEFIIILPYTNKKEAQVIAERIRLNIDHGNWENTRITVSIGVTTYEINDNANNLISRADEALYQSKKDGRNRVSIC